jgi:hypothetical protein
MALTAIELQANVDSLNRAIATGTRSVTLGGQTVIYNTTESLVKARNDQQEQLNALNAQTSGKRRKKQSYLVQTGRGYN